jgi:hypothetical protein
VKYQRLSFLIEAESVHSTQFDETAIPQTFAIPVCAATVFRQNEGEGFMTERGKSPPWDHNLRKPKLQLPPGACDTHFHFIGPQELYPLRPNHVFAHLDFEDDTMEDWLKLQETLGLSRGIHILSMMYKHGYELMLHSLFRFPERLRGVVCPHPSITDGELDVLTKAGVVGARYARRMGPTIDEGVIRRTTERGWSSHFLFNGPGEGRSWARQAGLSSSTWACRRRRRGRTRPSSGSCSSAWTPAAAG